MKLFVSNTLAYLNTESIAAEKGLIEDKKDGASGDTIVENPNEQTGQRKQPKKKKKKRK